MTFTQKIPEREFRNPTILEWRILQALVNGAGNVKGILTEQLKSARVRIIDAYGSLELSLKTNADEKLPDGILVCASQLDDGLKDEFGPMIEYILFAKSGEMSELQIFRNDGEEIKGELRPDELFNFAAGRPASRRAGFTRPNNAFTR